LSVNILSHDTLRNPIRKSWSTHYSAAQHIFLRRRTALVEEDGIKGIVRVYSQIKGIIFRREWGINRIYVSMALG
jgi:hypothetical protein